MAINTDSIRWASVTEVDEVTGLPNKSQVPAEVRNTGAKRNQPIARQWINEQFNNQYNAMVDLQGQIDNIVQEQLEVAAEFFYPIGSLFYSFDSVYEDPTYTPDDYLGIGVWERVEGVTLVGVKPSDADFDVALKTGGNKTHTHTDNFVSESHTLTEAEIPSHNHYFIDSTINTGSVNYDSGASTLTEVTSITTQGKFTQDLGGDNSHTHDFTGGVQSTTGTTGMSPYTTIHMFRRTA